MHFDIDIFLNFFLNKNNIFIKLKQHVIAFSKPGLIIDLLNHLRLVIIILISLSEFKEIKNQK